MTDSSHRARDDELRATLPVQEKEQPDPFLQMTTGAMGIGKVTIFVVAMVIILSVVLYGLNGRNAATVPPPNAGAVAHSAVPPPAAPAAKPNAKG